MVRGVLLSLGYNLNETAAIELGCWGALRGAGEGGKKGDV